MTVPQCGGVSDMAGGHCSSAACVLIKQQLLISMLWPLQADLGVKAAQGQPLSGPSLLPEALQQATADATSDKQSSA